MCLLLWLLLKFGCHFLSPEEEDTLLLNTLEEKFVFFELSAFSRRKLAKNSGLLPTYGSCYPCDRDGFRSISG